MSGLGIFGAFAGGVAGGYEKGANLRDKIETRKKERDEKKRLEQQEGMVADKLNQKFDEFANSNEPELLADPHATSAPKNNSTGNFGLNAGLSSVDYTGSSGFMPHQGKDVTGGMGNYANGGLVKKYADGGLIEESTQPTPMGLSSLSMAADPNKMSYQTQQETPQQTAQPTQQKAKRNIPPLKMAEIVRDSYYETARELIAKGDKKGGMNMYNLGFQHEDKIYKSKSAQAKNLFETTGNLEPLLQVYNDELPDGYQATNPVKTEKGYRITFTDPQGQTSEQEFTADQIRQNIAQYDDPATRYATRMKAEEEARKEKEKPYTLNPGEKRYVDGKMVAENVKADGGLSDLLDVQKAAENPNDPNYELANKILARQKKEKIDTAIASRAPREGKEPSFEQQAYEDWANEPQNKGKGKNQYLKEKAKWAQSEPLDTVTTSTEKFDDTGAITRESRTTKVKPTKPQSPKYKQYLDAFNKYQGNPEAQKEVTELFKAKGIVK